MPRNTFYITTAIDYASGNPHLGHAYEKIASDVIARWKKSIGKEVFFQTGTDEHGQKILEKAKENNINVKKFVDEKTKEFKILKEKLNLDTDYFIRTTDENHKKVVQRVLKKSFDNGDIYMGKYEGFYCIGCEKYYSREDLLENNVCPIHKTECQWIEDENYFFRLSKYQDRLLDLYEKKDFLSPNNRKQEIINRVKEGLIDISISRPKTQLDWGIELPFDKEHVSYVWFDALFNYYSSTEFLEDKKKFWPCDLHIVGKDVMWFHAVYWPAFLMSCNLPLPEKVHAHGMILDENGHKMSKSLKNVIDPFVEIEKFGLDEFRYFLISLGSFSEDLRYSHKDFVEKINNNLNNDLGNLISRVHSMTFKYFNGIIPKIYDLKEVDIELIAKLNFFEEFNNEMNNIRLNLAFEVLFSKIREVNAYINRVEPWKEKNDRKLATVMNILCSSCILFAKYLECIMPSKSKKIFKQFNIENNHLYKLDFFSEGHKIGEKENLFIKIKLKEKNEEKDVLVKNSFENLCLKVGKIISIKQHPDAEKLYIEEIDVGEKNPRQIVSGLKDYYRLEEMKGKKVIVLCNLKTAKLRGVKSEGMILACDDTKNNLVGLLTSDEKVGSYLQLGKFVANSKNMLKIDEFFKFNLESDGKNFYFDRELILVNGKSIIGDKGISGKVR
jgi:methionyl-tRNA synthetase